jgi:tetratricopeptide (TPR) repeat protein
MKRILQRLFVPLLLTACGLLLVSARPTGSAEELERLADAAFAAGQYAEADVSYSRAEVNSPEPGRLAFNHGIALFHLGRYRDAERLFRCSLESAGTPERKARAWFNLGTGLLYASNGQDANRLAEAMDCFQHCLGMVIDDGLRADARNNLELAKQLWRRIRKDEPPPQENESASDNSTTEEPDKRSPGNSSSDSTNPGNGSQTTTQPASPDGPKPIPTSQQRPGAGHLPPIPESEQWKPLPPDEARQLLHEAAERVARERKAMQKSAIGNEPRSYPDW